MVYRSLLAVYPGRSAAKDRAAELRQPYFAAHPKLQHSELALCWVRNLQNIYAIDSRQALHELLPVDELEELVQKVLKSPHAVRSLSTYIVNVAYLLEKVIHQNRRPSRVPLEYLYRIGHSYNLDDRIHLQLLLYLYTHCIIGETNFYTEPIPEERLGWSASSRSTTSAFGSITSWSSWSAPASAATRPLYLFESMRSAKPHSVRRAPSW